MNAREEQVAPGVVRLSLWPLDLLNVYLLGDVLVDSGDRPSRRRLFTALSGRSVVAHALTHAHFDHQGNSHDVCERFDIPLWCGSGDRDAAETGDLRSLLTNRDSWVGTFGQRFAGPGHPVSRVLRNGDDVGGFAVIEAPGHTPGHVAFWREADRVLVLGDVLFHRNPITVRKGLSEPFRLATYDARANRQSARRLTKLDPAVICFGHGRPLHDGDAFKRFVSQLPTD